MDKIICGQEGILEKTDKTRDIIKQSFEKSLLGFLDAVDAQRTHLALVHSYYQSLYDLHVAEVQLEKAVWGEIAMSILLFLHNVKCRIWTTKSQYRL